ncbi:hypothetical protein ANO14919_096120 [Xylariales sp. No.14919]|nr:hypothetical protein ANO14919_096120 [Xylariales sp. No.14919]
MYRNRAQHKHELEIDLEPAEIAQLRTDGTPISIYDLVACAASTSALEGEAKTCMKKLDEARMAVDTIFRRRCSVMLSFVAELQLPLQNTRLPFMEPLMVVVAIENASSMNLPRNLAHDVGYRHAKLQVEALRKKPHDDEHSAGDKIEGYDNIGPGYQAHNELQRTGKRLNAA